MRSRQKASCVTSKPFVQRLEWWPIYQIGSFYPTNYGQMEMEGKTPGVFCLKMDFPFAISGAFLGSLFGFLLHTLPIKPAASKKAGTFASTAVVATTYQLRANGLANFSSPRMCRNVFPSLPKPISVTTFGGKVTMAHLCAVYWMSGM